MTNRKPFFLISVPALLLAVTFILGSRPYYNWDLFPYMAIAIRNTETPFDSTHTAVFRQAALQMPNRDFVALKSRHPDLASDPAAFQGILRYFEIKPLYNYTVQFFHFAGIDLVNATYLPSVISYFLIMLLLFWWFQKIFPLPGASVLTLTIALLPFLTETARYSSPDMLCALLLFTGLFIISESSTIPGLIFSGLAIFVRPDASLFFLLLLFSVYQSKKLKLSTTIMAVLLILIITAFLTSSALLKEFLFTSVDYSSAWGLTDWMRNYFQGLRYGIQTINGTYILFFVFLAFITIYIQANKGASPDRLWSILVPGTLILLIIRFLLHPAMEDRMLVPCYLLIIVGFCKSANHIKRPSPLTI